MQYLIKIILSVCMFVSLIIVGIVWMIVGLLAALVSLFTKGIL